MNHDKSTPRSRAVKLTKHDLRDPDAFIRTIDRFNAQIQPNKRWIYAGAFLLILLAAGWAAWDWYQSRREVQAQEALFTVMQQVQKKDQEINSVEGPKEGKTSPSKKPNAKNGAPAAPAKGSDASGAALESKPRNLDADYGASLKSLQSVVDLYPATRASWLAALEMARIDQSYGQVDAALATLQKLDLRGNVGDLVPATAQLRAGDLLQIKGQCDQAITTWKPLLGDKAFSPLKPEAQLRTGLCQETLKKFDEARATYEKLSKDAPDSRAAKEAKKFLKVLALTRKAS